MSAGRRPFLVALLTATVFSAGCSDLESPAEYTLPKPQVSLARASWYASSPPVVNEGNFTYTYPDTARCAFLWYNIEPKAGVHGRDLDPDLAEMWNVHVPALDIEVDPAMPTAQDTLAWVGVMTGFPGGLDLTGKWLLEVWVNDFEPDPNRRGGRLRIDFGDIDEDFFEPEKNEFNDEDRDRDGFAAAFDDTGLDGEFDEDEGATYANPDPHGDDFDSSRIDGRFSKINGTEGNRVHDTEDLDRSGQINQLNAYYSIAVDLSSAAVVDVREQYPDYDGFTGYHDNDAWRLYRVDLDGAEIVSPTGYQPQMRSIHHMRVWFDHIRDVVRTEAGVGMRRVQIAGLRVVGEP